MRTLTFASACLLVAALAGVSAQECGDGAGPLCLIFTVEQDEVVVDVRGGEPRLELNGKPMPERRYTIRGKWILIKDAQGVPVASVTYSREGGNVQILVPRRKAALGITMGTPGPSLAAHLGLDRKRVVILDAIKPGSAAAKAGLEKYDVVTHIDGEAPATQQRIQEAVTKKKPGDRITLRVVRKGQPREIEVVLGAEFEATFDASTMIRADKLVTCWDPAKAPSGGASMQSPVEFTFSEPFVYLSDQGPVKFAELDMVSMPTTAPAAPDQPDRLKRLESQLERIEARLKEILERLGKRKL